MDSITRFVSENLGPVIGFLIISIFVPIAISLLNRRTRKRLLVFLIVIIVPLVFVSVVFVVHKISTSSWRVIHDVNQFEEWPSWCVEHAKEAILSITVTAEEGSNSCFYSGSSDVSGTFRVQWTVTASGRAALFYLGQGYDDVYDNVYLIELNLDQATLSIQSKKSGKWLDASYREEPLEGMGKEHTLDFVRSGGEISIYYNSELVIDGLPDTLYEGKPAYLRVGLGAKAVGETAKISLKSLKIFVPTKNSETTPAQ